MLYRQKRYYCPLCKGDLGLHETKSVFLVVCNDPDCKVKWCWKPDNDVPIALDYPGMKKSKGCGCLGCSKKAV